jgi:membrane-associated protease RseP (regulator of RpoE activity)
MLYRRIIIDAKNGFFKDYGAETAKRSPYRTNIILFIATLISTTVMGALMTGANPFTSFSGLAKGLPYSLTILSILGVHEFGHYFAARYWKVRATLPYFIPFPFSAVGTMGAVIKLKSSIPNKKALIDIGAAGPIAGFVVAVAASAIGLHMSEIVAVQPSESVLYLPLGESLLFKSLSFFIIGTLPENTDVMLHPVAFAGWLGLFVTALNLIPFGQLDGGHIMFAISPRLHELFRKIRIPLLLLMGLTFWTGWYVWAVLMLFFGSAHPNPDNIYTEIGPLRKVIAVTATIIFILCMIPAPVLFQ